MSKIRIGLICLLFCGYSCCLQANEALIKQGRALQNAKKYDEAQQLYLSNMTGESSEDFYVEAASFLGKVQRYDTAEEVLEKGRGIYNESLALMNLHGLIKHRKGDNAAAAQLFEAVLAKDSANKFAQKWLGTIKSTQAKPADRQSSNTAAQNDDDSEIDDSYSPSPKGVYEVSSSLSEEEQEKLAVKLYEEMIDLEKWELDRFIELHKQVIERCPTTQHAEESCWRLANLYAYAQEPPAHEDIIAVLLHLLKQYPDTELMPDAKNRLMLSYKQTGQMNELAALYEELFTLDPEPEDDMLFMARALEFANALNSVGRADDAALWYQKVLERDNNRNSLEARAARAKLEGR